MPRLLCAADAPREVWLAARRQGIGASEIAAVLGLSPWDSPFSLWWRKTHGWEIASTPEMEAGRRLEPVIAQWFADQNPDREVAELGLWANDARPWQIATPDRWHWRVGGGDVRLLECKTAFSWDGWGEPGTDEIPVHYQCQVLWQMDVMGVNWVDVAVYAGLEFRHYVVRRDEKDLRLMRERGRRFWESLQDGDAPELDDHPATLSTIRQAHPYIVDREQPVPAAVVDGWLRAKAFAAKAKKAEAKYAAAMRAYMGDAQRAICRGDVVASRSTDDRLLVGGRRKKA